MNNINVANNPANIDPVRFPPMGGVSKGFVVFNKLLDDTTSFGRIGRLAINFFTVIGTAIAKMNPFSGVITRLANTGFVIDTLGVLDPTGYFLAGKHKNETKVEVITQMALLATGILGVALLAAEMTILCLAKVSESLGTFVTIGAKVASGFVGIAFIGFAVQDWKKIKDENLSQEERFRAKLDLIGHVADIALAVIGVVGSSALAPLIILGTISASFGIASEALRHLQEIKEKENNLVRR